MKSSWRYIHSGARTGSFHMAEDERLALGLLHSGGDSVLRLYTWSPWAISLGHHQDLREVDGERCRAEGIDIVRRPTGGRAILHAEELTYCIVMPVNGQSVLQAYNAIGVALLRGLRLYGVDAALEKSQPDFGSLYRQTSSVPCFSSSARYEIGFRGRKMVGSAQRRFSEGGRTIVLQHGSILCGNAHLRLADYLRASDETRNEIRGDLRSRTSTVSDVTGTSVDLAALAACVKAGFEEEWGIEFQDHSIVAETGTLEEEKH
jgi:lipoate-protein ligase A